VPAHGLGQDGLGEAQPGQLGQVAGQKMLLALGATVDTVVRQAQEMPDAALSNWAPGFALLSMRHEVQYSRLYRS